MASESPASRGLPLPLGYDGFGPRRIVLDAVDRLAGQPRGTGDGAHPRALREYVPHGPKLVPREARLPALIHAAVPGVVDPGPLGFLGSLRLRLCGGSHER